MDAGALIDWLWLVAVPGATYVLRLAARLRRLAVSRREEASALDAEADALEEMERAPKTDAALEPVFVTAQNALALLGKRFAALDGWLRRRGVERLKVAGSPAYRLADVRRAIEEGADVTRDAADEDDPDTAYAALVAAQSKRAGRRST